MNRHWRLKTDSHDISWLRFNHADSPLNILSQEGFAELSEHLDELESTHRKGLSLSQTNPAAQKMPA